MTKISAFFWFAYVVALALMVGKISFFSFFIAPTVHRELEKNQAVKLLRVLFPKYYKLGIVCAIIALICAPILAQRTEIHRIACWTIPWALILLSEVYCLKVLVPIIEATREGRSAGDPESTRKWECSHKLSVRLNALNLLLGLGLIGWYVA